MAAAIQQLNARVQQQETAVTILTSERESLARQVQSLTGQRVRVGVVDTRVIGKPDQFDGDPMKCADWSFKVRSYLGAVDQRYQQELTTTGASSTPRLNATLDSEGSALSTKMYCMLVMTTAGAALDKCHNTGVSERFEAWEAVRDGVGAQAQTRDTRQRSSWPCPVRTAEHHASLPVSKR